MPRSRSASALAATGALLLLPPSATTQLSPCEEPWQLVETFRLGSVDGDDAMSGVRAMNVGPDGRIYLIQSWDHSVSVLEAAGRPAGRIGRAGSGPGEFGSPPRRMGWRADTLWVSDRFTTQFYLADGTPVRQVSFKIPMRAEASNFAPGTPLADGTFLPYRTVTDEAERFILAHHAPLRRLSSSGEIVDTMAIIKRHLADHAIQRETDAQGFGLMRAHPLAPSNGESMLPVVSVADGSAVVYIGDVRSGDEIPTFDLLMVGIAGDTLLHAAIPYEPLVITDQERDTMRERFAAGVAGDHTPEHLRPPWGVRSPERRRRIARELITFPDTYPPVRRILASADGSIWLLRETWPHAEDVWEIYDERGKLQGSARLEAQQNRRPYIFHAGRSEVWAGVAGALDVPYIVRYEVRRDCGDAG